MCRMWEVRKKKGSWMAPNFCLGQLVEYWHHQQRKHSGREVRFREEETELTFWQVELAEPV